MTRMQEYRQFLPDELLTVNKAVALGEELVSNYYKLSVSQMRQLNYDIQTAAQLAPNEIVADHFGQIIRYRAQKIDSSLETDADDHYKICLQDHSILSALDNWDNVRLYPFMLYIVCHELIHVVRFRRFLQHFHAPADERQQEEIRVHHITRQILEKNRIPDMQPVFGFYGKWRQAFDESQEDAVKPLTSE